MARKPEKRQGERALPATVGASSRSVRRSRVPVADPGQPRDGGFTLGRDAFARISAVEGIELTPEAQARAAEFDRRGLSGEERRRAIIKAHRPK